VGLVTVALAGSVVVALSVRSGSGPVVRLERPGDVEEVRQAFAAHRGGFRVEVERLGVGGNVVGRDTYDSDGRLVRWRSDDRDAAAVVSKVWDRERSLCYHQRDGGWLVATWDGPAALDAQWTGLAPGGSPELAEQVRADGDTVTVSWRVVLGGDGGAQVDGEHRYRLDGGEVVGRETLNGDQVVERASYRWELVDLEVPSGADEVAAGTLAC